MGSQIIQPPANLPRTPIATDLIVYERLDSVMAVNLPWPAFGTPHDTMYPAKTSYPNHKFVWRTGPDRDGKYTDIFIADLANQNLYNFQISNAGEWPTITQTFIVPRATYNADPADPNTLYPIPPNTFVNPAGYNITAIQETRIGEEYLDSQYVAVQVTREKLDVPITWQVFDPDTGTLRTFQREKVPAGTAGSVINDNGFFSETNPLNTLWGIKDTQAAAGLAGSATGGVSSRTWDYVQDYYWPPVLDYIYLQPVVSDPSNAFSDPRGYITANIWKVDQYNGPCQAHMVETWYKDPPPNILPDILLPVEIDFNGPTLNLFVPRCLHRTVEVYNDGFSQRFAATSPTYWPASMVISVDVAPQFGGWLQRVVTIDAPSVAGVAPGIVLTASNATFSTFDLSWTAEVSATHTTTLNIATSPQFDSGFLPGYQGLVLPIGTTSITVTGAQQGRYYYAQVTRNGITSNIEICGVQPSAVISVSLNGTPVPSGQSTDAGSIAPGETNTLTFSVFNNGVLQLGNLSLSITGTNQDEFDLGSLSATTLAPGQTATFSVTFSPTSAGSKSATVSIASDAANNNPYSLPLTGAAVAPVIQVEQPSGSIKANGSTVDFGILTGGTAVKNFVIRNVGTALLADLELSLSGESAVDYSVSSPLGATSLAPGGSTAFSIEFAPTPDDTLPAIRNAVLTILSNDVEEGDFIVNLTGVYNDPLAPGAVDPTFAVTVNGPVYAIAMEADGNVLLGGNFTTINGNGIPRVARVSPLGVVDATFVPLANDEVFALAVQEDGKILVGGSFFELDGTSQPYLGRIEAAGTLDSGYTPIFNGPVYAIAIQSDGKAVIGGSFTTVNGSPAPYLTRINTDGTLDGTFTTEVMGDVYGIAIDRSGKIVIVGDFPGADLPTTIPPTTSLPPTTSPPPTTSLPPTTAPPPTTSTPPTTIPVTTTSPPPVSTTPPPDTTTPP